MYILFGTWLFTLLFFYYRSSKIDQCNIWWLSWLFECDVSLGSLICNTPFAGFNMQWPSWWFEYDASIGCINMMAFLASLNIKTPLGIYVCNDPFENLAINDPLGGLNIISLLFVSIWYILAFLIWMTLLKVWMWWPSRS